MADGSRLLRLSPLHLLHALLGWILRQRWQQSGIFPSQRAEGRDFGAATICYCNAVVNQVSAALGVRAARFFASERDMHRTFTLIWCRKVISELTHLP